MKRLIIDIKDMILAQNIACLASRKRLSIEDYIIWLMECDVREAARSDWEFRLAEQQYEESL
jgi:hypothetical protein